ncbi:MAG: transcription antitermination factor NusB [Treponema sp.]|jgi:N utilization substance protein B|nr:transcription antitermination factor NusB [Treponema sp.]
MASRRKGRILAFQALYAWESNKVPVESLLDFSWLESDGQTGGKRNVSDFSRLLIAGTLENIAAIDAMIKRHLQNWDFSRLNRVDLAILRMSAYSLMFQPDMHPSIVINEAIGISKEFGADDSYRFINGVLDSIKQTICLQRTPEG